MFRFIEYSNSKENTVKPHVAEYDGKNGLASIWPIILGVKTLRELGILLDFQTKEISIDEISLPMRDKNSLSTSFKIENAWSVNQSMIHELQSTEEATQCAIWI